MAAWAYIYETINFTTGARTFSYSHTPEQYVAELRARGERFYVTRGSCAECIHTPDRPAPLTQTIVEKTMAERILPFGRHHECICGALARHYGLSHVPEDLICYGFYYRFIHRSPYLKAVQEADLVTFYDITDLPTLKNSGHALTLPLWME